jgi:hypothetical protein
MTIEMSKPWLPATAEQLGTIPATTGVYEIRRRDGEVLDIGYVGARAPFGLASTVPGVVAAMGEEDLEFRCETHVQYQTRYQELVLVHKARNGGQLPARVAERPIAVPGRLSPG